MSDVPADGLPGEAEKQDTAPSPSEHLLAPPAICAPTSAVPAPSPSAAAPTAPPTASAPTAPPSAASAARVHSSAPPLGSRERQVFWVLRHGDRLDNVDTTWRDTAEHPADSPLSELGHVQAQESARAIIASGHPVDHIIASPFLRAIETSLPLSRELNIKIKLERSVGETGGRKPPPPHNEDGFPLEEGYESLFTPKTGERSKEFRPRLALAAKGLLERFPFDSGNIAIFSHADPVAYLVAELTGVDPAVLGPVTVCAIFQMERRRGDQLFTLVKNSSINHLSSFGSTEPCHPVHAFHDWCRLFCEMKEQRVVDSNFRWPPYGEYMTKLKKCWEARYQMALLQNQPPLRPKSAPKVEFECPRCNVVSYMSLDLYSCGPMTHNIKCWKCKVKFRLAEIS